MACPFNTIPKQLPRFFALITRVASQFWRLLDVFLTIFNFIAITSFTLVLVLMQSGPAYVDGLPSNPYLPK
ncbi:hypothetical protein PHLCEN_2v3141 [Hermanssonia centrifuga]|uniref:Uncharacterized protein n=1 Tax=Hermanssonia centrifuga TaxID=98765 RepID=A0A2R6R105_9APHY|nr:hypothetical protein PHLCEN_2v3141 [Hermanssonia centrifuga]